MLGQDVRQTFTDATFEKPRYADFSYDGITGAKVCDSDVDGDDELAIVRMTQNRERSTVPIFRYCWMSSRRTRAET